MENYTPESILLTQKISAIGFPYMVRAENEVGFHKGTLFHQPNFDSLFL